MQLISSVTEEKLEQLASELVLTLEAPMTICLWGDLGAGKTTFCRALIRKLCPDVRDVPSPTFTIVQEYASSVGSVWHCDLYRLETSDEIEELGILDAFHEAICLIEWPERLGALLPANRLDIRLVIEPDLTRTLIFHVEGTLSLDFA